ncbi:DUF484 domain-containing protein [Enterobacteriaceae bacterium LUAb1]
MKNIGEQPIMNPQLNDDAVSLWLLQNPDFFIRHARQMEQMRIPHPVRGTVSLVEWLLARQRSQISKLEEEITLLMEHSAANQQLFEQLLDLQIQLATAASLHDMLGRFRHWAHRLGLADVNIRLFSDCWNLGAPSDFTQLALSRQAFVPVCIQRFGNHRHYLGSLNGPELLLLLPQAKHPGSVAMSMLGEQDDLGVLIFSSRDTHHYQPGMGTDLLRHLAQLVPALLTRWIERL